MDKATFINRASENAGLSKRVMTRAVDAVLETLTQTATEGEKVKFVGWGNFTPKTRNARRGRNPNTGEAMDIPSKNVLVLEPGKPLLDKLNNRN
ncbi:MAG: HU family DNA-binding protein [Halothece sp.]